MSTPSRKNPIRVRIGLGTTLRQVLRALSMSVGVNSSQLALIHQGQGFSSKDENVPLVDLGVRSNETLQLIINK